MPKVFRRSTATAETIAVRFFEQPQVAYGGASGGAVNRRGRGAKPIYLKPMVVNRRLHKSVGAKWGPRKSRFERFLAFLRSLGHF